MERIRCRKCGAIVPKGRLKVLPDTDVCVRCSEERPRSTLDVDIDGPDNADMCKTQSMPIGEK